MAIRTDVKINDVSFGDYQQMSIQRTVSKFGATSNFTIIYDSPFGRHDNDFVIGDDIKIYANKDAAPTTIIFRGIIEQIKFSGKGTEQRIELRGRDYSARLQDVTVEPVVYTNSEVSTIVTNIITNEVRDITTTNVDVTQTSLNRIAFNHMSVYDALKKLAELSGFIFYVDTDNDLHFEVLEGLSSGITLDNSNIMNMRYDSTREDFVNQIFVYGDKQLSSAPTERLLVGSPNAGGTLGSVFTLLYRPHNTQVSILGSIRIGGIWELTDSTASGVVYLVNYFDKQLIFPSGTNFGYYLPPSGGSIMLNYEREVPIVKFGENDSSVGLYGPKEKHIVDKNIKDPTTALDRIRQELEKSNPLRKIECAIKGWYSFTPGNTLVVNMPNFNLNNQTIAILNVEYTFNSSTAQSEQVIKLVLDNKIVDLNDKIKLMDQRIKQLESADSVDSDTLTRAKFVAGSISIVGSYWEVRTNRMTGSVSYLYSTILTPPISPLDLASGTTQGILAGSFTGSAQAYTDFAVQRSGGYSGY